MKHFVVLEWMDACGKHGWTDVKDAASITRIVSVGLLVKETKKAITISTSYSPQFGQVDSPMTIPRTAIKKMKKLSRRRT